MSDTSNIKNWLEAELKEDDNDPDNLSAAKFNEQRQHMRVKEEEDRKKAEVKRRVEVAAAVKQRAQEKVAEEAAKKRVSKPLNLLILHANSKRLSKSVWSRALKGRGKERGKHVERCAAGVWSAGWSAWPEWVVRPWHASPAKTQRPSANSLERRAERRKCARRHGLRRSHRKGRRRRRRHGWSQRLG